MSPVSATDLKLEDQANFLISDGLPLASLPKLSAPDDSAAAPVAQEPSARPLALDFETKVEDDPTFLKMVAAGPEDVTYCTSAYCYPSYCTQYITHDDL
ncbi:MAG TPA: hypothetical protein VHZ03_02380 [Trebonia sp.]|jgi:hypothetical protein|nr:hypothetical protein [Trebonia sp.]